MSVSFMDAVKDVTEVLRFENWLRFYFIREVDGKLYIQLPEEAEKKIREEYPQYWSLVETMQAEALTQENSTANVCRFVVTTFDGPKYTEGTVPRVFDSPEFAIEMHLFNTWVQSHETQLDNMFLDFNQWNATYDTWKNSEQVVEYFEELRKKAKEMEKKSKPTAGSIN